MRFPLRDAGRHPPVGAPRGYWAPVRLAAALACAAALSGCMATRAREASRPLATDVTRTGAIADAAPAVVAAAQEEVGRTMRLGLMHYRLNVGDNLEISLLIDSSVVQPT
ncbi:hypothetical protein [uncultured Methylobacterium sp.]|uniref:hypothetical protein n=1 Tax=uncultured Methylobacterium sp. TaxID=157278 RepID=UPI0035CAB8C0